MIEHATIKLTLVDESMTPSSTFFGHCSGSSYECLLHNIMGRLLRKLYLLKLSRGKPALPHQHFFAVFAEDSKNMRPCSLANL
jgi:hypothetical protein